MGDINRQLRDYLSRNEAKKESSIFASTESLKKLLSPSSGSSEPSSNVGGSNGWFSEAADDSCLPSLKAAHCWLRWNAADGLLLHGFGTIWLVSPYSLLRTETSLVLCPVTRTNEPCKATVVAEAASIYDCLLWDHICNTLLRIGGQKHTIDGAVHNMPVCKHNLVCARLDPWWRDRTKVLLSCIHRCSLSNCKQDVTRLSEFIDNMLDHTYASPQK
ncbi:uncharacterized protein LOC119176255 isoform X1 [Rhipicephalus microplus]|uniref:uncharacterized protein LOC119176255 isoform X1 n=1 Tax=Rhipicephalus microplus TaxID=6941 RepID=UPI003F6AB1E5